MKKNILIIIFVLLTLALPVHGRSQMFQLEECDSVIVNVITDSPDYRLIFCENINVNSWSCDCNRGRFIAVLDDNYTYDFDIIYNQTPQESRIKNRNIYGILSLIAIIGVMIYLWISNKNKQ